MFWPIPFEDELHSSYFGRIITLNTLPIGPTYSLRALRALLSASDAIDQSTQIIELLAFAANMPLTNFVREHTLLPYRRSIASYKPDTMHGDPVDPGLLRLSATRAARPGAYFCDVCVEDDRKIRGMSYWRRTHQLTGMYICMEHRRALRYTEKENAFLLPPSAFLETSHLIAEDWVNAVNANAAVGRFLALSVALSSSAKPFELKHIRPLLAAKARECGISVYGKVSEGKALLSDTVLATFPTEWLDAILPGISAKQPGQLLNQVDGVLYLSTCASSMTAYLLAISILFSTPSAALAALASAAENHKVEKRETRKGLDPERLRQEYVRSGGAHSDVSKEMGEPLWLVKGELASLGLPNLKMRVQKSLVEAAAYFYLDGKSMDDSAKKASVPLTDLERIVRLAGAELSAALKQILPRSSGTKADAQLGKNQHLHLMGYANFR